MKCQQSPLIMTDKCEHITEIVGGERKKVVGVVMGLLDKPHSHEVHGQYIVENMPEGTFYLETNPESPYAKPPSMTYLYQDQSHRKKYFPFKPQRDALQDPSYRRFMKQTNLNFPDEGRRGAVDGA